MSIIKRYAKMIKTKWFKKAYKDKSMGEQILYDDPWYPNLGVTKLKSK